MFDCAAKKQDAKRVESKFTFSEATAFMQYNFCGTLNLTFGLLLQISENREMFYSCFKGREGLFDSCFDQTVFNLSYLTIAFL